LLLNQLAPQKCDLTGLKEEDPTKSAAKVVDNAHKLECGKFLSSENIVEASRKDIQTDRFKGQQLMNIAFVTELFKRMPGLTVYFID
jgi:hypothetical protein